MKQEFEKPLIVYKTSDRSFHFFKNEKQLGLCSYQAYKKGFYKDLVVYTTSGKAYIIDVMKIVKYRKFPLIDWLLLSPTIELEFEFIPAQSMESFESFKRKLSNYIKRDNYFEGIGMKNKVLKQIEVSGNFEDLSAAFDEMLQ